MKSWLAERLSMYEHFFTDDPYELISILRDKFEDTLAVSLDHDLHERLDGSTELTGMMVAEYLAGQKPGFPILLHTSNSRDGERMKLQLLDADWSVDWVKPFDDTTWIGNDWYPTLKKAMHRFAKLQPAPAIDDAE